jgi:hypothetical protein
MMLGRYCSLIAGIFLLLAVLSVSPASAAGQAGASCGLLPWEETATPVSTAVNPLGQDQTHFIFKTSCTSSSQCGAGQACNCGQCHAACGTGQRWNCICQVCYNFCPSGYFFDDSVCACQPI